VDCTNKDKVNLRINSQMLTDNPLHSAHIYANSMINCGDANRWLYCVNPRYIQHLDQCFCG